jgi:hypothetical protein
MKEVSITFILLINIAQKI